MYANTPTLSLIHTNENHTTLDVPSVPCSPRNHLPISWAPHAAHIRRLQAPRPNFAPIAKNRRLHRAPYRKRSPSPIITGADARNPRRDADDRSIRARCINDGGGAGTRTVTRARARAEGECLGRARRYIGARATVNVPLSRPSHWRLAPELSPGLSLRGGFFRRAGGAPGTPTD